MLDKTELQAILPELLREGRRRLGEPPSPKVLFAYLRDELPEEEQERIREYLAYHPEVVRLLTSSFDEPAEDDPERPGDADLERDWAAIRARLDHLPAEALPTGSSEPGSPDAPHRLWPWRLTALAAIPLLLVLGVSLWTTQREAERLREELLRPRSPDPHLLIPDGSRGEGQPPIALPSRVDSFLLQPALVDRPHYPDYRARIRILAPDREAEVVWEADGLQRQADDTFPLWVPRGFLEGGPYRLELLGLPEAAEEQLLATYTLRLGASP